MKYKKINEYLKKRFKLIILIIVIVISCIYYYYYNKYIHARDKQIDWLADLQITSGAIKDSKSPSSYDPILYKITPYYANFAAEAILCKKGNSEIVKEYIKWYFSKLNWPDKNEINGKKLYGTINDYYVDSKGIEKSTNDYDSADAYAATFLSLLKRYNEISEDKTFLKKNESKIDAICKTLVDLIDNDGLAFAKPNYQIKFLMDNCEVYKGLKDISSVYKMTFRNDEKSEYYKQKAEIVKNAIIKNFQGENEFYVYKDLNGVKKIDWNKWYPDSVAQIFPLVFGVIDSSDPQATILYNKINEKWDWINLNASNDFPWVLMGDAGMMLNRYDLAKTFHNNVNNRIIKKTDNDKWNSIESAWFIRLSHQLGELDKK